MEPGAPIPAPLIEKRSIAPGRGGGYLLEMLAGQQDGAAGLRALVVGGPVALLPHPLGLPPPAPPVPVGAGTAEELGAQRAGGAAAHPAEMARNGTERPGQPREGPGQPPAPPRGRPRRRGGGEGRLRLEPASPERVEGGIRSSEAPEQGRAALVSPPLQLAEGLQAPGGVLERVWWRKGRCRHAGSGNRM